jgi:hypothetical protein
MKKYISVFVVVLCGCQLVVDIDVPYDERLTLNSFFTADSLWQVTLTANRHILDEKSFRKIAGGTVTIYDGDQPIETLIHVGDGIYKSSTTKPAIGKAYKISAVDEKLGTVTSTSFAPLRAEISSLTLNEEPGTANKPPHVTFQLQFQDAKDISNYYQISVDVGYLYTNQTTKKDFILWQPIFLQSDDPVLKTNDEATPDGLLFKDILFDGKSVDLKFAADGVYSYSNLRVSLRTLSEDYFKYASTTQLQNRTTGDPFAQPTNVYNNIDNGYGIFAGYGESIVEYSAPKPVITEITPLQGRVGDRVIILGENFPLSNFLTVEFNGNPYTILALATLHTKNKIEVIVPQGAISGRISILSDAGTAISPVDFEVIK